MTKYLAYFLMLWGGVFLSLQAHSEPSATSAVSASAEEMPERMRLSRELHDVRRIRDRIDDTITAISKSMPESERADFLTYMSASLNYDKLEDLSVKYAAETYTVPELQAMIAYFGSPDGQAAEAKGAEYAARISKDIEKEIDAAMLAVKLKERPQSSPKNPFKN